MKDVSHTNPKADESENTVQGAYMRGGPIEEEEEEE